MQNPQQKTPQACRNQALLRYQAMETQARRLASLFVKRFRAAVRPTAKRLQSAASCRACVSATRSPTERA